MERGKWEVVRGVAVKAGGAVEEEECWEFCEEGVGTGGRAEATRAPGGGGGGRGGAAGLTERATTVAVTAGTPLMASAPRGGGGGGRENPS